jgi:hypothetical protein
VVVINSQAFLAAHATEAFSSSPTFLVEACITVPGGSGTMDSGYLWRENVGGVHPEFTTVNMIHAMMVGRLTTGWCTANSIKPTKACGVIPRTTGEIAYSGLGAASAIESRESPVIDRSYRSTMSCKFSNPSSFPKNISPCMTPQTKASATTSNLFPLGLITRGTEQPCGRNTLSPVLAVPGPAPRYPVLVTKRHLGAVRKKTWRNSAR